MKGAYNEPAEIAYPRKNDVDASYMDLAKRLLSPEARKAGVRAAIATHDRALIASLIDWATAQGVPKNRLEFQMLYGIQRAEQLRLTKKATARRPDFLWDFLVSLVYAPPCRTPRQCYLPRS